MTFGSEAGASNRAALAKLESERYRHLSGPEVELAAEFLAGSWISQGVLVWDCCVGSACEECCEVTPEAKRRYLTLYAKRIDLVNLRPDGVDLVEFKPDFGMSGLGQLLVYRHWWMAQRGNGTAPRLWAVGRVIDRDVRPVLEELGVRVVVLR